MSTSARARPVSLLSTALLAVGLLVVSVSAFGDEKKRSEIESASTVTSLRAIGADIRLELADGTDLTLPREAVRFKDHRQPRLGTVAATEGAALPDPELAKTYRLQLEALRKFDRETIETVLVGSPVFVKAKLDKKSGELRQVDIELHASLDAAQASLKERDR